MWTDSHCHLDSENAPHGEQPILERARSAGVSRMIAVGVGRHGAALNEVIAIAERESDVYFSAGIHPHDAKERSDAEVVAITQALAHPRCVALGEVGLDYYYDNSPREEQGLLFDEMLALANQTKRVTMLHIRSAHDDALQMLQSRPRVVPGMVHCFTEDWDTAKRYLDLGFYLSIPGILTFKTAEKLREAVQKAPRDRIVVETDSPYLAPIPMRGKKNEPSFLPLVGAKVAEIWGLSVEETARITSENATCLFGW